MYHRLYAEGFWTVLSAMRHFDPVPRNFLREYCVSEQWIRISASSSKCVVDFKQTRDLTNSPTRSSLSSGRIIPIATGTARTDAGNSISNAVNARPRARPRGLQGSGRIVGNTDIKARSQGEGRPPRITSVLPVIRSKLCASGKNSGCQLVSAQLSGQSVSSANRIEIAVYAAKIDAPIRDNRRGND